MAYITGDLILDDHYNIFATGNAAGTGDNNVANLNTVWGVGNGDKGYGQSSPLSPVSAGTTVTATQWTTLLGRLNTILTHQSGSGSGITNPTAGSVIAYISALQGKINDAWNNRLTATESTQVNISMSGTWNQATPTTFTQVRTFTFASANQARYFFNCGGGIQINFTPSAGTDNAKESNWTTLIGTNLFAFRFFAETFSWFGSGLTPTINNSNIGYYDLTTSDQTLIRLTEDTSPYTANYVDVLVRSNGTQGANGDKGSIITFTINYVDDAADSSGTGEFNDSINMNINAQTYTVYPKVTSLSNVWGAVTMTQTTN